VQDFQNIRAWQRARALSLRVDSLARRFPRDYRSLRSQIRRAADGISAAIAEGCGAATQREFARFLDIAIKSASETQSHIISARDRRLISDAAHSQLVDEVSQIRRMLYALRKKVLGAAPDRPDRPDRPDLFDLSDRPDHGPETLNTEN
jgi:four helix bundle protein